MTASDIPDMTFTDMTASDIPDMTASDIPDLTFTDMTASDILDLTFSDTTANDIPEMTFSGISDMTFSGMTASDIRACLIQAARVGIQQERHFLACELVLGDSLFGARCSGSLFASSLIPHRSLGPLVLLSAFKVSCRFR